MIVSVLVPTYNRPALLEQCLASLKAQTMPAKDYEVLVINDGGQCVQHVAVASGISNLVYRDIVHTTGQSAACNAGLTLARGQYLTVAHDDDLVLPIKLEILAKAIPGRDVVYGLPRYTDARGNYIGIPPQLVPFMIKYPMLRWADIENGSGLWVHGTGPMYRTDVVRAIGGWDESMPAAEEYDLHLRLLFAGHAFHAVQREVVTYRSGGRSRNPTVRAMRKPALKRIYAKFVSKPVAAGLPEVD